MLLGRAYSIAACGIETFEPSSFYQSNTVARIALPLAALKLAKSDHHDANDVGRAYSIAACGIETLKDTILLQ